MSYTINPELLNEFESHAHSTFFESLVACEKEAQSLDSPYFTMCLKASGFNFRSVFDKWLDFKLKLKQHRRINQDE